MNIQIPNDMTRSPAYILQKVVCPSPPSPYRTKKTHLQ